APVIEAEEGANAHVVNTCLLGPVESCQAPLIIPFLSAEVIPFVCLRVIGLLEYLLCAYPGPAHGAEPVYVKRGSVDVHPADLTAVFLDPINQAHRMCNVLRAILRVLTVNENQSLLAVILQGFNLRYDLRIGKGLAFCVLIGGSETAVLAVVYALVSYVKGCEQHYPVAIDFFLQLACACLYFLNQVAFGVDECSCLSQSEALLGKRLCYQFPHPYGVSLVIINMCPQFGRINERLHPAVRYTAFFRIEFHFSTILIMPPLRN